MCVFMRSNGVGRQKRNATLRSGTRSSGSVHPSVVQLNEDTANLAATISQFEQSARMKAVIQSAGQGSRRLDLPLSLEWRSIEFYLAR